MHCSERRHLLPLEKPCRRSRATPPPAHRPTPRAAPIKSSLFAPSLPPSTFFIPHLCTSAEHTSFLLPLFSAAPLLPPSHLLTNTSLTLHLGRHPDRRRAVNSASDSGAEGSVQRA
ncbi:hypothetical protein BCR35DRAFT_307846 [Leucosporidium creatinivorum]|uniref:Uncharacterized protein n=1 Tax=Leucosporidium creatinivorum TaxID=106004 RepID=A0A1Y2EH75_9BASI|nr:hypothetical protein BCR35DRAFT_307846 [Leucosporidium creatinivorum]